MSIWLTQLVVSAIGLSFIALFAWIVIRLWKHAAGTVYRFLVTVLAVAILMVPIQAVLLLAQPARAGDPLQVSDPSDIGLRAEISRIEVQVEVWSIDSDIRTRESRTGLPGIDLVDGAHPIMSQRFSEFSSVSEYSRWLLLGYLAGCVLMAVYQTARILQTVRFLARCRDVPDERVLDIWRDVAARSTWRNRVRLRMSADVHFPCCWGLGRPYLVIPEKLDARQLNALPWSLRHELIHLERNDSRIALLQALFMIIHWYHPAAWWLSRQLNWWREVSCDFVVVQRTGRRRSYALALVDVAMSSITSVRSIRSAFLHWVHPQSHLRQRVEMLVNGAESRSRLHRRAISSMALVAMGLIAAGQAGIAAGFVYDTKQDNPPRSGSALKQMRQTETEEVRIRVPARPQE